MTQIPLVTDGRLQGTAAGGAAGLAVGSPAWFAWLAEDAVRSFSFRSPAGAFTARKEGRQRGGDYWVGYRTAAGRQHKIYLGKAEHLTPERLTQAAAALAARAADPAKIGADGVSRTGAPAGGSSLTSAGLPLLATKLFVPRPRPDLVPRPRLLARLDAAVQTGRCSLLSASAGSGKTSLLAAWLARLDRPVAWLTLDERDQDLGQVLRYLVGALQTIAPQCGGAALAWLDGPQLPPPEVLATVLVNDLVALSTPSVLVLDDYHLVRDPAVHATLAFLLDHLPPSLHLVIASRQDPPLPLPRLRARGQLVDVRASDLEFRVAEAVALLDSGMGLHLTESQVTALVARTEGWAAGLQLAGLALRDRSDPAAFVTAFTGGNRLVADYLMSEVLDRQPAQIRRFLLVTGVLDRLCAPLCDELLASDAIPADTASSSWGDRDSQEYLDELERTNLFLVPLDDERVWYRYHHLFAGALRARLIQEAGPGAAAVLHRQASAWFGREKLLPEAIDHALAGSATEDAALLIEALMPTMFANVGIHQALTAWLAALPESVVRSRPLLCLTKSWLLIHRLEYEPGEAWVEAAAQSLPAACDDTSSARGAVAATRAFLATLGPAAEPEHVGALAERALADLRPEDAAFRGIAGLSKGQAALASGQTERAEHAFAETAAISRAAGLLHGALVATTHQVNVQRLRGARRRALANGRAALTWAGEHIGPPSAGLLQVVVADLLLDENDLAAALPLATEGLRAQRQYGNAPPLVLIASLPLVRLHLAEGKSAEAEALLAEARELVQYGQFAHLTPLIDASEAQSRLARGETATAVAWAESVEPTALPRLLLFHTHFFAAAIEASGVAPARILVAQGRQTGDTGLLSHAEHHLEVVGRLAEEMGLGWLRLRTLILRALLDDAQGDREAAHRWLASAVAAAQPEGVLRPFLDEGEPMMALLADLRAAVRDGRGPAGGPSPASLGSLLAAFPGLAPEPDRTGLLEPLSARELEVLRLLAAGRSNAEMAAELFVEQSTVKTHLIHLYRKLGAHSRTQAVAVAQARRLLH